jgi:septal ring factor EnvC (AmiA/AmiB activator)
MFIMKFFVLSLFLSFVSSVSIYAAEGETDAREQCRILVSGTFLSFMNDLDVLKNSLSSTTSSVYETKAKRVLAVKQLKAVEDKLESEKTPAAELDEEVIGLRYQLDTTDEEIRDAEARIVVLKDQIAGKEKAFKNFKEAMKTVFEAVSAKIVNQGAYPLKIQYRHLCSKYQQLCPLPSAQSASLSKLSKLLDDGLACERYANMRG